MLHTLRTLFRSASAVAEDNLKDANALALIDQHIRDTEASLRAAKTTLASLIQRHRSEVKMVEGLDGKIADLTTRATEALEAGREDLAGEAAESIAQMENERRLRQDTVGRLDQKMIRLRSSVEAGQRRVVELRQGAIAARAVRNEQRIQGRLSKTVQGPCPADEAQEMIDRVLGAEDKFEQSEILREIEADLNSDGITERMAQAGFGAASKSTKDDVLKRLKAKS